MCGSTCRTQGGDPCHTDDTGPSKRLSVTAAVPQRLRDALSGEIACLVLSPHLDDAVLSCGGLLRTLAERNRVTVATVFTEAAPPPHTRAARSFVRQCQADDVATLFADRRAEDRDVLDELGVRHLHLAQPDALFRRSVRRTRAFGPLGGCCLNSSTPIRRIAGTSSRAVWPRASVPWSRIWPTASAISDASRRRAAVLPDRHRPPRRPPGHAVDRHALRERCLLLRLPVQPVVSPGQALLGCAPTQGVDLGVRYR